MAAVVSDASPLVHLAAIRRFELLKLLYSELFVPRAVWEEVTVAGKGRPGSAELSQSTNEGWIRLMVPTPASMAREELRNLDAGEAEALALALDLRAEIVLLDELRGRAAARQLGLRAIGTLGVLIEAKRRGLVSSFRAELERLGRDSQMQLSEEIKHLAIRMAGE